MKTEFPGYFPISESDSNEAWKNGLFSFDASVLLGLYRYSDDTKQELLKLLRALEGKLWITHRAALEFLNGRLGVISAQSRQYQDSITAIETIQQTFNSVRAHPFLSKQLAGEAETFFKRLRSYLIGKKSQIDLLVSKDSIQEEVATLLKGRIGGDFTDDRLRAIFSDGDERYKTKVPPGYEDAKKPEGDLRFGDLLIWFELIEKAKSEKKSVTFVTADEKEDWWRIWQGKMIGPRPELVAEMRSKAGVAFQMFSPERFMEVAAKKLSRVVKETAIKEVKENRKAELSPSSLEILRQFGGPLGPAFDPAGIYRSSIGAGLGPRPADAAGIYGPTGPVNIHGAFDPAGIYSTAIGAGSIPGATDPAGIYGPAGPLNVHGAFDPAGIYGSAIGAANILASGNPALPTGIGPTGLRDPVQEIREQLVKADKRIETLTQQLRELATAPPPPSDPEAKK